jgi:uncharacterized protein (UPF0212 family)
VEGFRVASGELFEVTFVVDTIILVMLIEELAFFNAEIEVSVVDE